MRPLRPVRLLLLACGVALAAPAAAPAATVTVAGSAVKIRPNASPGGPSEARLIAARNEFESFQVVVRAPKGEGLRNLRVTLAQAPRKDGFSFPDSSVLIYREAYYDVRKPTPNKGAKGRWPDALIPTVDPLFGERRRAFPVNVPAGENRVAWVDVLVPRGAPRGTYPGSLRVRADGVDEKVPLRVEVLPLVLPSTASLQSFFEFWNREPTCRLLYGKRCEERDDPYFRQAELFTRLALDNRISITGQQVAVDDELTERHLLPYLRGTGRTRLPGARLTTYQVGTGAVEGWREMAERWGYVDRSFLPLCDEPDSRPKGWDECRANAEELSPQWPEAHKLITTSYELAKDQNALSLFDTIVPILEELQPLPRAAPHQRLWFYTSCISWSCGDDDPEYAGHAGHALDQPASESRATGWIAFMYGATGELLWRVENKTHKAWRDQYSSGANGDGTLFYIGRPGRIGGTHAIPIESLRLKLIRDGYEDYEYLLHLARTGRRDEAMTIARSLFPTGLRTNRSDAKVQEARRRLAELIAG